MKKTFNLFIILLFSLMLSQTTCGTAKDKGLVKLQTWLKGLKKNYTIQELKKLKKLDLSSKQLKSLPPEIENLKALTDLRLSSNQLKSVPKELGNLKALTSLWLSSNQLKSVPKELGNLKALTELYLKDNPLSDKEKAKIKKLLPKCRIYF
ncbi:MAG: hypothetical protein IEMM0008_0276 [bacterium]|nr:MAG: hypothetical protein IEMM0008_0276 [bacterium]